MPEYAIFNIEYRLFNGGNLFPTQEKDIQSAIDFITGNAPEYAINKNKFVLLGASAGAHLALLQAYKYDNPQVQAVIDFFGPADLTTMYNQPWHPMVRYALEMITGTTPKSNPGIYISSSPVNFISANSPATLILHGSQDQVVDVSQSRLLKNKLDKAGVANELVVYSGERHGWYGKNLTASFDTIERFLRKHVN
jgi:acetyl esterase/lipase